jgi:hypothetical protein
LHRLRGHSLTWDLLRTSRSSRHPWGSLTAAELLVAPDPPKTWTLTRRQALPALGLAGGASLFPTVDSIAAPLASSAASCVDASYTCMRPRKSKVRATVCGSFQCSVGQPVRDCFACVWVREDTRQDGRCSHLDRQGWRVPDKTSGCAGGATNVRPMRLGGARWHDRSSRCLGILPGARQELRDPQ